MYKMKRYLIAISMMIITSVVSLFVVSVLTYMFKWQASKAMIGIIVTYVLAGFLGGVSFRRERKQGIVKNMWVTLILSFLYILVLILCSIVGFQMPLQFSRRFIFIGLLVVSSIFCGICVKR